MSYFSQIGLMLFIGEMSPDITGLGAIDMPSGYCGMRHTLNERSLKIEVTQVWRGLFNRAAPAAK
jgi:hypothetical protein